MFKAKVVADSVNSAGDRITTMEIMFPRIVLAEFNTHRVFSRNSASSRAIPYRKMVREVMERPFIPMAFQKDHSGMQGTQYYEEDETISLGDYAKSLSLMFKKEEDQYLIDYFSEILSGYVSMEMTPRDWWLLARDKAVESSLLLSVMGISKQLCNRILEPFMWHKALVTSTSWSNFFHLRCPQYFYETENSSFSSRKNWNTYFFECTGDIPDLITDLEWLKINKSHAEIHISRIAELMFDALAESRPQYLRDGEWHMPYSDQMNDEKIDDMLGEIRPESIDWYEDAIQEIKLKISTARAARLSYQTLGDNPEISYEKDVMLHDDLFEKEHMSPFEHCGQSNPGVRSRNFTG